MNIPWYRRLRARLIGTQIVVVIVGVTMMVVATRVAVRQAPGLIRPNLTTLLAQPDTLPQVEQTLLNAFQRAVLTSVSIAAVGAVIAGVISSIILWRTLINPLRRIAAGSQRIADGRYDERVALPAGSGEAMTRLVTNFNQMAAALENVEQQRIAMIGNVTHELRTPLTGLRGYVEGLADGLFPATPDTFALMESEINRLSRLVDDIQVLSRVESGAVQLTFQPLDLAALIERTVAHLQPQARQHNLTLTYHPAPDSPIVYADSDRTAQILTNLIGNAVNYTREGGIVVTIGRDAGGTLATVTVQDSGIGIPAEALPFIFERFYRVDASRSRASGGSGVGLTISRHLAWAMGGTLHAHSDGPGRGSTFTLALPLHRAD